MPDVTPITGELQAQIMSAMRRRGSGTVEQVRAALPPARGGLDQDELADLQKLAREMTDRGRGR